LNIYRKTNYKNEIIVCFHKYDPGHKATKFFWERKRILVENIIDANPDMKFQFFNTSCYNLYSLTNALSYILKKQLKMGALDRKLREFTKKISGDYAIIFSSQGLIISDYFEVDISTYEINSVIIQKMNEDLAYFKKYLDGEMENDEKTDVVDQYLTLVKDFSVESFIDDEKPEKYFLSLRSLNKEEN
jgi:hypothetical protein